MLVLIHRATSAVCLIRRSVYYLEIRMSYMIHLWAYRSANWDARNTCGIADCRCSLLSNERALATGRPWQRLPWQCCRRDWEIFGYCTMPKIYQRRFPPCYVAVSRLSRPMLQIQLLIRHLSVIFAAHRTVLCTGRWSILQAIRPMAQPVRPTVTVRITRRRTPGSKLFML